MPYVLQSRIGDCALSIEIVRYEFQDPPNVDDANWLIVRLSARTWKGRWQAEDPALLTSEVEDLITWCRGGYDIEPLLQFVEPCLQFQMQRAQDQSLYLAVSVAEGLLPPWSEGEPMLLELFLSDEDIKAFAQDLESQLAQFPFRNIMTNLGKYE